MLALGLFTFSRKGDQPVGKHFLYISLSVSVWLIGTALGYLANNAELATFWFRVDNVGVAFISPAVYAFSRTLLGHKAKKSIAVAYLLGAVVAIFTIASPALITGAVMHSWGYYPTRDLNSLYFFAFFFTLMGVSFTQMLQARKSPNSNTRAQAWYMLIGFGVAYVGSVDYIPTYQLRLFGADIYPFGYIFITVYVSIMAFAILRQGFMNVKLIIRDSTLHIVTAGSIALVTILLSFPVLNLSIYLTIIFEAVVSISLMAFAYDPIRRALQPAVDRLMFSNRFAYLEELAELPNDILEFSSMREMLNFLVSRLTQAARLEHAAVMMYDPAQQAFLSIIRYKNAVKGAKPVEIRTDWSLPQNAALNQVLNRTNRVCTIDDLNRYPELAEQAMTELKGFEGTACFGVMRDKQLAGLVILGKKLDGESFNHQDIQILNALKLRVENFLLQALTTTEESLNMVKDSHDMKNDVNALKGRIPLRRIKLKTFERTMVSQLQALADGFANAQLSPDQAKSHIESLKEEITSLSRDQQSFFPIEEDALDRLRNKLQNWSEFGRLVSQSFKGTQHKEPIDVTATAKISIERWTPAAMRKRIDLISKIGENLTVHGERSLVEQVLDNLIDNAIKATDNGSVTVTARRQDGKIAIDIVDTGCGFSEEALKTILTKPFYQGEGRQSLEKSTGIGLVLVNMYVKNLGGEIHIESKQGAGATFHVLLPAIEATEVAA